jgi:hypothetical protein
MGPGGNLLGQTAGPGDSLVKGALGSRESNNVRPRNWMRADRSIKRFPPSRLCFPAVQIPRRFRAMAKANLGKHLLVLLRCRREVDASWCSQDPPAPSGFRIERSPRD